MPLAYIPNPMAQSRLTHGTMRTKTPDFADTRTARTAEARTLCPQRVQSVEESNTHRHRLLPVDLKRRKAKSLQSVASLAGLVDSEPQKLSTREWSTRALQNKTTNKTRTFTERLYSRTAQTVGTVYDRPAICESVVTGGALSKCYLARFWLPLHEEQTNQNVRCGAAVDRRMLL
jgi:hypothetical protein